MKNLKKLMVVFMLLFLVGGLTSCSQINKVTKNFEEQGFNGFKYTNKGESLVFEIHDDLVAEEVAKIILAESTGDVTTTETTTEANTSEDGDDLITTNLADEYYGFDTYMFTTDEIYALVIEFESQSILEGFLETSVVLQTYLEGRDAETYTNGNCILIVPTIYADMYDYFVDVFQGNLKPIEITETTTVETSTTETTAVAD